MKVTGTVQSLELDKLRFENLKGAENRCQESLEEFKENDRVIIVTDGRVNGEGNIEASDSIYFVKVGVAPSFLARFIENLQKETNNEIVKVD